MACCRTIMATTIKHLKYYQMKTKKTLYTICLIISFLYVLVSCKKNETEQSEIPYLFRPIGFTATTNKTVATLNWIAVDSAISYTIQISKDSLLFKNIVVTDSVTSNTYTIELAGSTFYSARVKANAKNPARDSKYNQTVTFKTPSENLFLGYSSIMIEQGSASITWSPGQNATKLVFIATGKDPVEFAIDNSEKAAGVKACTGLVNGVYTVNLYNNDALRGSTKLIIEGDYWVRKGGDLLATLNSVTIDSAVIVVKPGIYSIGGGTYSIAKNIKIRGLRADSLAIISMGASASTTATMFSLSTNQLNGIYFENIEFSGIAGGGTTGSKIGYMFNQSTACSVGAISFKNCIIRNIGNTPFRLQAVAAKSIGSLSFDKCRIFDIGYTSVYAVVNVNIANTPAVVINNISFTNSTVYNFAGSLILHNSTNSNSVTIQNCTFNELTTSGTGTAMRYFVDYTATMTATNGIIVQNCIFGSTPRAYSEGIRAAGGTNISVSGSYNTSDYKDNNAAPASSSIMSMLTPYTGASTALFKSPLAGDFTIIDLVFPGKSTAGDPRWRL
jgi:hypothetical protein